MKYCLNYNQDTEHSNSIQNADEWNIIYNSKDNTLLEFLELHQNKRINLYIKDKDINFTFLKELCEKFKNLYIKLNINYYLDFKPDFRFFYDIQINDWDSLIGVLKLIK